MLLGRYEWLRACGLAATNVAAAKEKRIEMSCIMTVAIGKDSDKKLRKKRIGRR